MITIEEKLYNFFAQISPIKYEKNEIILRGGDTPQGVYFIKNGYVKLNSVAEDGKELTLILYKRGEFFPVVWAFYGERPSIYSFEAVTDCEIFRAPRDSFMEYITTNRDVFLAVTKGIIARYTSSLQRMEYLTFGNASAKLASILLICAKDFGVEKGKETEIQVPLTHKDIANLVGVTRETVSLELKKFDNEGLIAYNKKNIIIKNKEGLKKEAIF